MSGCAADCNVERVGALAEALGPVRLAGLVDRFRADLAALVAAADTLDEMAFRHWAHRLQGSGSTLGFDAVAAALAAAQGDSGAERPPWPEMQARLATAEAALARGAQVMAAIVPGLDAGGAAAQDAAASKR